MNKPTPDEIKQAKADALERFGRDEVLVIELGKPVDFCIIAAPMNLERHCKLVDAQARDFATSFAPLVLDQILWPERGKWLAVAKRRAAAPKKAAMRILARAGREDDPARVTLLDELVAELPPPAEGHPEAEQLVIPGLAADKARELLAAEEKTEEPRELWAVVAKGLSCVMAAPDPDVYLASQVAADRAREKKEGITEARLGFTKEAIVWSASPIDKVLDDRPACTSDLASAWLTMGGEVADTTMRSF